ncbi:MAG: hypothetical protein AB7E60_02685 [Sphingobium sp.]
MAQQIINTGATANDGTGDDLRAGAGKINANFTELYAAVGGKQNASPTLTAIAAVTPIADGPHTVGGITITTVNGIITAIS